MSETLPPSGPPSRPPSGLPASGMRVGDATAQAARGEQALKIIGVTDDLQNLRTPLRLDGEVSRVSRDGTRATITTDKGEVEVQLRPRTVLEVGQKVQIDLPPGHPPRQVILRNAPAAPQPRPDIHADAPPRTSTSPGTAAQPSIPDQGIDSKTDAKTDHRTEHQAVKISPQPNLPPALREALDQLNPTLPVSKTPSPLPARPVPLMVDAIIRLLPLAVMPPDADLLPAAPPLGASLPPVAHASPAIRLDPASSAPPPLPAATLTTPKDMAPPAGGTGLVPPPVLLPDLAGAGNLPLQSRMIDNPALHFQSIRLPIQQQIFPFIIPVSDHAVPPPQDKFDMRVMDISPHPVSPQTTNNHETMPAPSPGTIQGQVIATTMQHFPVLSMTWPGHDQPDAFLLQFPASNLPVGTLITLQPQAGFIASPLAPGTGLPSSPLDLMNGWTWPAFDDALQSITAQMPVNQAAAQIMGHIPNPATPSQIPPAMLFFMAAIGAGDLGGWMGDKAMNALRRDAIKGADIVTRLTRDFAGLSRMADDPVSQDWKGAAIPMMWQNDISKIHVFYRHQDHDKDDDTDSAEGRSTRFLFDFNLTQIGDVQLDGFMKEKRLDLIVRTQTLFSPAMQNHMRTLYRDVLDKGGLSGDLGFQNRADQWVVVDLRKSELHTSA